MGHRHLTLDKREILERLLSQGHSIRSCARILGYSPSAICQEVKKGAKDRGGSGPYSAQRAHSRYRWHRSRVGRINKGFHPKMLDYVREGLERYWSPEQIAERVRLDHPHDARMRISFKTIYRWLHKGAHAKKATIWTGYSRYLRLKRSGKVFGHGRRKGLVFVRQGLPSIEDRAAEANARSRFGDWECDLIRGYKSQGYLVTLLERSLGLLLAHPCPNKTMGSVNKSIASAFGDFPKQYIRTITFDRGKEFYDYEALQDTLQTKAYFCHPNCPNERGQNEQINGLLRQFFPKYKPLSNVSVEKVKWAVDLINNRPKKKWGYRTTMEMLKMHAPKLVLSFI